jgi:hypothetical protein
MGPQFFQTIMGRQFFDYHVPTLITAMGRIATQLEKMNEREEEMSNRRSIGGDMDYLKQLTNRYGEQATIDAIIDGERERLARLNVDERYGETPKPQYLKKEEKNTSAPKDE